MTHAFATTSFNIYRKCSPPSKEACVSPLYSLYMLFFRRRARCKPMRGGVFTSAPPYHSFTPSYPTSSTRKPQGRVSTRMASTCPSIPWAYYCLKTRTALCTGSYPCRHQPEQRLCTGAGPDGSGRAGKCALANTKRIGRNPRLPKSLDVRSSLPSRVTPASTTPWNPVGAAVEMETYGVVIREREGLPYATVDLFSIIC